MSVLLVVPLVRPTLPLPTLGTKRTFGDSEISSPPTRVSPCIIFPGTMTLGIFISSVVLHHALISVSLRLGVSSKKYQFSKYAIERYTSHFGPLNQRISIANHTVLLIDAPGLVDEDRERAASDTHFAKWAQIRPDRTIAFVQSYTRGTSCLLSVRVAGTYMASSRQISCAAADYPPVSSIPEDEAPGPVGGIDRPILFTHVPLSRPEGSSCGPLRERGTLRQGRGLGYQNLLLPEASRFLLDSIQPAVIFR